MSVLNEPVEDGIAEGGLADHVVPVFQRQLAGDQGGATSVAVLEDLEQVAALWIGERGEPEVVEDEEPCLLEPVEHLRVGSVGPSESEPIEEPRESEVASG